MNNKMENERDLFKAHREQLEDRKDLQESGTKERVNSMSRNELLKTIIKWKRPKYNSSCTDKFISWFHQEESVDDPLHYKILKEQIQLLLPITSTSNGDVKFADDKGRTILHLFVTHYVEAASYVSKTRQNRRDAWLIRTLIKMGASLIASDHEGDTPLGLALSKRRIDLVSAVLRSFDPRVCSTYCNHVGETVSHVLIDKYTYVRYTNEIYMDMIRRWSDTKVLSIPDKNGITPAHLAAKLFNFKILKKFDKYKYEVDCNLRTNEGDNLLIFACKNIATIKYRFDLVKVIKWLLNKGCKVNCKNNAGFTALHYASQSIYTAVIYTLTAAGADVCAVAIDGTTPLYSAVMLGHHEMMHKLYYNRQYNNRDLVYGFTLLHVAALSNDIRKFNWAVKYGSNNLNDRGKWDVTPLHLASLIGNAKVVQKLIGRRANVHCKDKTWQCTPLHLAAMRGGFLTVKGFIATDEQPLVNVNSSLITHCFNHLDFKKNPKTDYTAVTIALLNAGVDVNARDNCGRTALHYATLSENNDDSIIEVLLLAGAHVDVQDREGFTPLHSSLIHGCFFEELLVFGADINDIDHPCVDILGYVTEKECKDAWYTVLEHLVKLKVANLRSRYYYKTKDDDNEGESQHPFYVQCEEEVSKMKGCKLKSDVSLYDLLHMDFKRRLSFVRSLPFNVEDDFPQYYPVIRGSCLQAINRESLIESAKEAYQIITETHWPDLCMEHIFSFLSNKWLRALVDSASERSVDCIALKKLNIQCNGNNK